MSARRVVAGIWLAAFGVGLLDLVLACGSEGVAVLAVPVAVLALFAAVGLVAFAAIDWIGRGEPHDALAVVAVVAVLAGGCALHGGPRRYPTVAIVGVTATLDLIQQTEMGIVCGRPGAPQAPLCVPISTHRQISAHIRDASALAMRVTDVVAALPTGTPAPADVMSLMVQVNALVQEVLRLLPSGKTKAALLQQTGLEVRR